MKKLIFISVLFLSLNCYSQEVNSIFKMNGEILTVNVTEINESIQNLTPAEVYYWRCDNKLKQSKRIKNKTQNERKKQYQKK